MYYSLNPNSPEAIAIKAQIVWLSVNYGVMSPFTQFYGGITFTPREGRDKEFNFPGNYKLVGNYPNPFNPSTTIKFLVNKVLNKIVYLRIYNVLGKLVAEIPVMVRDKGTYTINWNANTDSRIAVSTGIYFYSVDFGDDVLIGKMMLIK